MTFKKRLVPHGTVITMVSKKIKKKEKQIAEKTIHKRTNMDLLTIWRNLVDLGSHFGAHWILKGSPNRPFSHQIEIKLVKRGCRKVSWKNIIFGWVFDVKMGGLDNPEQAFRIILVAMHFMGIVKYREN